MAEILFTVEKILADRDPWFLLRGVQEENGINFALTCKGSMAWKPEEQETLALVGEWIVYKGERQFQFFNAKLTLPLEPRSQLHYVCERSAGIGTALEQAIWDMHQEQWRELKNGEIKGLRKSAFAEFKKELEKFDANREKAEIIAWLESKGCTPAMAAVAHARYGNDTAGVINQDCYKLAYLSGYSFRIVDEKIRRNFGIEDEDPRRLRSAVLYAMEQLSEAGNTAIGCIAHFEAMKKLLPEVGEKLIVDAVKALKEQGEILIFSELNLMALRIDYEHEVAIDAFFNESAEDSYCAVFPDKDILCEGEKFKPDETQIEAVFHAVTNRAAIINGGAGVGKTTVIRMIVRALKQINPRLEVKLCAPTGKAAARLREASGLTATTIHSMLGCCGENEFKTESLSPYAIIIDEASMVDSSLMFQVIKRNPARLILVGDQAQLTPVGKGAPFHDLIERYPETVRTLTKCYRNTEAVYQAAMQVRNGNVPAREQTSSNEHWVCVQESQPEKVQELIVDYVKKGMIDFKSDIILCPKNGEQDNEKHFPAATVNAINESLLKIDRERRGVMGAERFIPGDRIINTKNNPACHVWNGTTGNVLSVTKDGLTMELDAPEVLDDGGKITTTFLDRKSCSDLRYAYALTIHKSQGSQYRNTYVAVLPRDRFQLDRSLLYTAITRTKQNCAVIGDYKTMIAGIQTLRRKTTILQILQ